MTEEEFQKMLLSLDEVHIYEPDTNVMTTEEYDKFCEENYINEFDDFYN